MNLVAPFSGTVVAVPHAVDETVDAGTPVVVLEAMKMAWTRARSSSMGP